MKGHLLRQAACGLAFVFLSNGQAWAGTFQVGPVSATLSVKHMVAALTVRNTGADPATIQLQAMTWSQVDGKDTYAPADDLLATPPIFTVPAGASQVIRVGSRRAPDAQHERTYRLFLREVPPAPKPGFRGLRIVLEINLPVFVQPLSPIAPELSWQAERADAGHVKLTARNTGTAHVRLSHFALSGESGKPLPIAANTVYILPGSSHTWLIPSAANAGSHLKLAAETDAESLQTDVVVAGP
jgi:fimbrial chaperone protein